MTEDEFWGGLFMFAVVALAGGLAPALCWIDQRVLPVLRSAWRTVRWEVGRMVRLARFHVAVWLYNMALTIGGEER